VQITKIFHHLKHHILRGFREIFIHHHSSMEFRAKLFALVISPNENYDECVTEVLKHNASLIYEDQTRSEALVNLTNEYLTKVNSPNGLGVDELIADIQRDLKEYRRFATKIDISLLLPLQQCTEDEDDALYQNRILEFLERRRAEIDPGYTPILRGSRELTIKNS